MRKALNENPMVQLGVLGVVGVIFAFILFSTVLKGEEVSDEPQQISAKDLIAQGGGSAPVPATPGGVPEPTAPAPADAGGSATPTAPSTPAPAPTPTPAPAPPAGSSSADGLLPGKGLPKEVLVAYARNKAIALLVVEPGGISDKAVQRSLQTLLNRDDVVAFKVNAKDIGDYSRITQGVNVSQAPALVVIRPRDKTNDEPVATVSYGFRSAKSIKVALEDALYSGGTRETFPGK